MEKEMNELKRDKNRELKVLKKFEESEKALNQQMESMKQEIEKFQKKLQNSINSEITLQTEL
jgi:hypothetical protein